MHSALQRYLGELDQVIQLVEGTPADRWDAPTPCPDWSARQLLAHLVDGRRQGVALVTGDDPRPEDDDTAVHPVTADLARDGEFTCDRRAGAPW